MLRERLVALMTGIDIDDHQAVTGGDADIRAGPLAPPCANLPLVGRRIFETVSGARVLARVAGIGALAASTRATDDRAAAEADAPRRNGCMAGKDPPATTRIGERRCEVCVTWIFFYNRHRHLLCLQGPPDRRRRLELDTLIAVSFSDSLSFTGLRARTSCL